MSDDMSQNPGASKCSFCTYSAITIAVVLVAVLGVLLGTAVQIQRGSNGAGIAAVQTKIPGEITGANQLPLKNHL